jgi:ribose transport system permease protein
MKGRKLTQVNALAFAGKYGTLLCLLAMIVVFSILLPPFRSANNLLNLLGQTAILSIMAAGMTCTLKMGDFDLSIGAIAALTGIVTANILLAGGGIPLAIVFGLATGLMVGLINGLLVAYIGLNAFVCTLATMSIISGLCLTVTKGIMLFGLPQSFEFFGRGDLLGVPFRFIFMFFLLLILWFFHKYTPTGRRMEAIGGNPVAAQLSGIKVEANRVIGYLLSGFCAAAAGIILASSTMSATSTQGGAYLLDAFGASFIGASTVRVGQFHIPGTFVGVLIVVIAINGLVILMVPGYLTDMIKGAILLLAILLSGAVGKFLQTGR